MTRSRQNVPLRLEMWGVNLYTGGHFDDYQVDFHSFLAGPPPAGTFTVPAICPPKPSLDDSFVARHQLRHTGLVRHLSIMHPNMHFGNSLPA